MIAVTRQMLLVTLSEINQTECSQTLCLRLTEVKKRQFFNLTAEAACY